MLQAEPTTSAEPLSRLTTLASCAKQVMLGLLLHHTLACAYMPYCSTKPFTSFQSAGYESKHTFVPTQICFVQVLLTADPKQKAALTHLAWQKFKAGAMPVGKAEPPARPARPLRPQARRASQHRLPYISCPLMHTKSPSQPWLSVVCCCRVNNQSSNCSQTCPCL